jgi:hypothetical protein
MQDPRVVNRFLAVVFVLLTVGVVGASIYYKSNLPLFFYGALVIASLGTTVLHAIIFLPLMAAMAKLFGGKPADGNDDKNEEN